MLRGMDGRSYDICCQFESNFLARSELDLGRDSAGPKMVLTKMVGTGVMSVRLQNRKV